MQHKQAEQAQRAPQAEQAAHTAPHSRSRVRGALATQIMVRRGMPGWCADVVQWALLLGVVGWGASVAGGASVFFGVFGAVLGWALYRGRPAAPWARALVVVGVPLGLTGLLCWGFADDPYWVAPLAMLPAADIGARVGALRERVIGVKRSVLARDWHGVAGVGRRDGVWFDVRPLNARVTRAEQREFRARGPRTERFGWGARLAYVVCVVVVMPLGIIAMLVGISQEIREHHDDMVGELLAMSAILSLMLVAWIVLLWWSGAMQARVTSIADHVRFFRFAAANGLEYLPGPVAGRGGDTLSRVMQSPAGRRGLVIANREGPRRGAELSQAQLRDAGVQTTHFGAFCEIELAAEMPHIWVHSTHHRAPAFAASTAPARSQRLSLEGNFDDSFELYCPAGYERDALYLFTPDVMAWLIDDVRGFDIELIERRLVFRSRGTMVTRDPEDWAYLARALQALQARIVQWERWRDDRVHPADARLAVESGSDSVGRGERRESRVGAGGRRLRLGIGAGAILVAVYGAVYLLLTALGNTL